MSMVRTLAKLASLPVNSMSCLVSQVIRLVTQKMSGSYTCHDLKVYELCHKKGPASDRS